MLNEEVIPISKEYEERLNLLKKEVCGEPNLPELVGAVALAQARALSYQALPKGRATVPAGLIPTREH